MKNPRFPLLSSLSKFWRIVGWLVTVLGLIIMVLFLMFGLMEGHLRQQELLGVMVGGILFIVGLGQVALGEIVGVFFAIESNTRRTADLLAAESQEPPPAGD